MRLSIVLWFVMVSEQFEQIFQNMLLLRVNIGANPLKEEAPAIRLSKSSYLNARYDPLSIVFKSGTVVNRW